MKTTCVALRCVALRCVALRCVALRCVSVARAMRDASCAGAVICVYSFVLLLLFLLFSC